jgi:hypothetical protein
MKSQRKKEINEGVLTNLQRIFCMGMSRPLENRQMRMSVVGVMRSADDIWGTVDRMDAFLTTNTLIGTRVEMPARPRGTDPSRTPSNDEDVIHMMCDENMDFVVVNNSLEEAATEQMPDALPADKTRWWLQSTYFWHAIARASRVLGINVDFPKEATVVFSNSAEYFWSVMEVAEKFFRQHLPSHAVGGLYLEPLGVVLLFKSSRNTLKLYSAGRRLLVDVGRQYYDKCISKQRIIIKKGTPLRMETYSDELSVPQMLNNLKPVQLFSSEEINAKMHELMPLQTGSLRNGTKLLANRDIDVVGLVYQWNIHKRDSPDHNDREIYHAIDYAFQNRAATFLFTTAFPDELSEPSRSDERQQETFVVTDKSEFMLSFSAIDLASLGGIEFAGQTEESAFDHHTSPKDIYE